MSAMHLANSTPNPKSKPCVKRELWGFCAPAIRRVREFAQWAWLGWVLSHAALAQDTSAHQPHLHRITSAQLTVASLSQTVALPFRVDQAQIAALRQDNSPFSLVMPLPPAARPNEPMALYIPRIGNQAVVRLQSAGADVELVKWGQLGNDDFDAAKAPRWIDVHPVVLAKLTQPVTLKIELTAQHGRYGGLSTVYWGSSQALLPLYEANHLWRQTISSGIVFGLGMMGVIALAIWWPQRDPVFGLFAITALLGMLRMGDRLIEEPWLDWPYWGVLIAMAYAGHLLFLMRFCLQFVQPWSRPLRWVFWGIWLACGMASALSLVLQKPWIWSVGLASLFLPALYVFHRLIQQLRRQPSKVLLILFAAGVMMIAVGLRDFIAVRLAVSSELTFSFMPVALFIFVFAMGYILVDKYLSQSRGFAALNRELEDRIAARDAQLRASFIHLQDAKAQTARLDERARIMRDIHDGVGAHLVGLVGMLKQGQRPASAITQQAMTALDELRMAVDALQPVEGSLATVLATVRYRLEPRLKEQGIELDWQVDELPYLESLTPERVLEVQRIVFESFANILRHSQATKAKVSAFCEANAEGGQVFHILMEDNGVGFPAAVLSDGLSQDAGLVGQGVKNMRWRAQKMGAALSLKNRQPSGAILHLRWVIPSSLSLPP
jgi:signal transduction histidine kinase